MSDKINPTKEVNETIMAAISACQTKIKVAVGEIKTAEKEILSCFKAIDRKQNRLATVLATTEKVIEALKNETAGNIEQIGADITEKEEMIVDKNELIKALSQQILDFQKTIDL